METAKALSRKLDALRAASELTPEVDVAGQRAVLALQMFEQPNIRQSQAAVDATAADIRKFIDLWNARRG